MHIEILMVRHINGPDLVGAEAVLLNGIFVGISIGTCQLIHAAVRAWIHYIMLNMNRFSLFGTDKGHGMVTVLEIRCAFFLVLFY